MANRKQLPIYITAFDFFSKQLKRLGAMLGVLSRAFFNLKTAILGAVGVGGFGLLIRQSLIATDSLAKAAGRIGTTTDQLSKLQYVAGLTGVETATLNMAMQRLTRRVSEAANGSGEARGALKELGLDAEKLAQTPLEGKMIALSKAFTENADSVDHTRLAMRLFDSEGVALVNTLNLGEQGMRDLMKEAELLGVVMDENAAAGVEAANDALFRLTRIGKGLTDQFVAALAPALKTVVDNIRQLILDSVEAEGGIRKVAETMARSFLAALRSMVVGLQGFIEFFDEMRYKLDVAMFNWDRMFNQQSLQRQAEGIEKELDHIRKRLQKKIAPFSGEVVDPLTAEERERLEALERELMQRYAAIGERLRASIPERGASATALNGIIEGLDAASAAIGSIINQTKTDTGGESSPSGFLDRLAKGFENLGNTAADAQAPFDQFAKQTMATLQGGFTSLIDGSKKASQAFKDMAKSIINSLIQMFIQYKIVEPLFEGLFGDKAGGSGGALGSLFGSLFKRERGGPVAGGRPYLVGERGPELMVPAGNGSIVPNNALGGGGVTVVQNINVTTGVQQTVRAEIANLLPQISNAAKSAVADARMRGGGFSRAMVGA